MKKKQSKTDTPIVIDKITPKLIKRASTLSGASEEDTELILRKYIDYCYRKKGADFIPKITPKQLKKIFNQYKQLLKALV